MFKRIKKLAARAFANTPKIIITLMFLCAAIVALDIAMTLIVRAI